MSAVSSKPGQHHTVLDWLRNNQQLAATAHSQRLASAAIRQEGRSLRSETLCRVGVSSGRGGRRAGPLGPPPASSSVSLSVLQTAWDESDTSRRLSDRAGDVARWKEALESCTQEVDKEMEALTLVSARRKGSPGRAPAGAWFLSGMSRRGEPGSVSAESWPDPKSLPG